MNTPKTASGSDNLNKNKPTQNNNNKTQASEDKKHMSNRKFRFKLINISKRRKTSVM